MFSGVEKPIDSHVAISVLGYQLRESYGSSCLQCGVSSKLRAGRGYPMKCPDDPGLSTQLQFRTLTSRNRNSFTNIVKFLSKVDPA
jgi:hypothetical protein